MLPGPEREAEVLLAVHGGDVAAAHAVLAQQFMVLQTRTQLLLTLATITLTISGFSGAEIAGTGTATRWALALGLVLVLLSVVLILIGSLSIRWVTQLAQGEPLEGLAAVIRHRERKTRIYLLQLFLLVAGLVLYVAALIAYLALGAS